MHQSDKSDKFQEYYEAINPNEVENYLRAQTRPVWESELLHNLFPELNLVTGKAIEMYRWHFVLYNHLFKLQQDLLKQETYLHIHFMNLFIIDFPKGNKCRHYYSDSASFCEQATTSKQTQLCPFHLQKADENSLDKLSESYFYLDPQWCPGPQDRRGDRLFLFKAPPEKFLGPFHAGGCLRTSKLCSSL